MKKIGESLLVILLLFFMNGCKNLLDGKKSGRITITLPGNSSRVVTYYKVNEVDEYYIELLKDKVVVDNTRGKPGETISLTTVEEGDYEITVVAYNDEGIVIAEGKTVISLNEENLNPIVKIKIIPNVKTNTLDIIILGVGIEWNEEGFIPDTMILIHGNEEKEIEDFYMSNTELTYTKWYQVYSWALEHGYKFINKGKKGSLSEDDDTVFSESNQPVTNVSFIDAIVWCNAASERAGYEPVFFYKGTSDFEDKTKVIRNSLDFENSITYSFNSNSKGYRLPTNEEYIYVLKGEKETFEISNEELNEIAWFSNNSENGSHEVATTKRNEFGLFDLIGNVYEWSLTSKEDTYQYCGKGCWSDDFEVITEEELSDCLNTTVDIYHGFRVVRSADN